MNTAILTGILFDAVMAGRRARWRRDTADPRAAQTAALRRIVLTNADTEFGRRHGFGAIARAPDAELWRRFREEVPIQTYADFAPGIERMKNGEANILVPGRALMFSLTSGTTSAPKFCPVTRAFIREHHGQHLLWMHSVYRDHPRLNGGKYLVLASPAEMGRTPGGIPYGAMSGRQVADQSIPVRRRMAAPASVQTIPDAGERWFATILHALAEPDLRLVTAVNPSSLIEIAKRLEGSAESLISGLEEKRPARARELRNRLRADGKLTPGAVWPALELLLTWQGGSSAFYLPRVREMWGAVPQRCLGLRASEGTFSIPLADGTPDGVLAVGGHALEFVPEEEGEPGPSAATLPAGELEKDRLYRLVVTTSGGFYRYDMADLVRVTGFHARTPIVAFERRAGALLSATGEKVTEGQALEAMTAALAATGERLTGFTVTYEVLSGGAGYVVGLEFAGRRTGEEAARRRAGRIAELFDRALAEANCEYKSKREDGRLAPPRAVILEEGSYARLRTQLATAGGPESQIKLPILSRPSGAGTAVADGLFIGKMRVAEEAQ